MERFTVLGFPTPRLEDWRKTNVAPIATQPFRPVFGPEGGDRTAPRGAQAGLSALGVDGPCLVFVNGRFQPDLSDLRGVAGAPGLARPRGPGRNGDHRALEAMSLADAAVRRRDLVEGHLGTAGHDGSPFAALNTAFLRDGAFVHLPAGCAAETPLAIVFLTAGSGAPTASHPRVLVVAGQAAMGRIVEIHADAAGGDAARFSGGVTELVLGAGAVLDYDVVQPSSDRSLRVTCLGARLGAGAALRSRSVCLGGRLVRNDVAVRLDAEGADCALDGLFLVRRGDHVDNHTVVDHARPRGTSRELYKGILASGGRGVFDGKIIVRPDARLTDAMQVNRNLLLDDSAVMDTKPQLEILNNDVKCKHAATIGRLDEAAVFYLRSRAIGALDARRMLVAAFAGEILSRLSHPALRSPLAEAVTGLLDASGGRP